MANSLVKTVETAFVDILASFDDECVISREVQKYSTGAQLMERANDTINRPMPYILNSQERVVGTDITFQDVTQRQVPSTIDQAPSVALNCAMHYKKILLANLQRNALLPTSTPK